MQMVAARAPRPGLTDVTRAGILFPATLYVDDVTSRGP